MVHRSLFPLFIGALIAILIHHLPAVGAQELGLETTVVFTDTTDWASGTDTPAPLPDTPAPVEPDTTASDTPAPVEPDTTASDTPAPVEPDTTALDTTTLPPLPGNPPPTTALSQEAIRKEFVKSLALQLVDHAVILTNDPDLDKYVAGVFAAVDKQIPLPALIKDVIAYLAGIQVSADPDYSIAIERAQKSAYKLTLRGGRKR